MKQKLINDLISTEDEINYSLLANEIGHNNAKKVSAILEILKIDIRSVADTKLILQICEVCVEKQSVALLSEGHTT